MGIDALKFDWKKLDSIQQRLPVTESIHRVALIVKTVGYERANDMPWATIRGIDGRAEFFTMLNYTIRVIDDLELFGRYIATIAGVCLNTIDQEWLHDQALRTQELLKQQTDTDSGGLEDRNALSNRSPAREGDARPGSLDSAANRLSTRQPHFVRRCLRTTLSDNEPLRRVVGNALVGQGEASDVDRVLDRLLDATGENSEDFPLRRFRRLLKKLREIHRTLPEATHRSSLVIMKDLLTIASFPTEDMQRMEYAMMQVLAEDTRLLDAFIVNSNDQRDAEKLLIATRIKLSGTAFEDWQIPRLLNHDFRDGQEYSTLLEKLLVIPEPTLPPDVKDKLEWYAECCIRSLGYELGPARSWRQLFDDILRVRVKDDTVIAMFVASEKQELIGVMRENFPRLLLIVLSETNALRYSQIYIELQDIENSLKRMLVSSN